LYGTLRTALLFWRRFLDELTGLGFIINPYYGCEANKTSTVCTIPFCGMSTIWRSRMLIWLWFWMQSHLLESLFGVEAWLIKTRRKWHEYVGMTIDYSVKGKVRFTMLDYFKGILVELPLDMDGEAPTPAPSHLFAVNPDTTNILLDSLTADMFNHNVGKLLFLCNQARPDIQTAVAFLCTCVKHQILMTTRNTPV
jgi:hypothetical protein